MNKLLLVLFVASISMTSCLKTPEPAGGYNGNISRDLQDLIEDEGIEGVKVCCVDCTCNVSYSDDGNYSFEGSSFIEVNDYGYNLNNLTRYEVVTTSESGSGTETKKFLVLYFP